jgi:predicted nucleic acid-binding protein
MRYHLDTDFLVYALSSAGSERRRLRALGDSDDEIRMSAVAWYEFSRGPRTPEQLAVARSFLGEEGVVPFSEGVAAKSAEVFRRLGSPRMRSSSSTTPPTRPTSSSPPGSTTRCPSSAGPWPPSCCR